MKEILEAIKQRLLAKVDSLKYIDEDWGQLDYYSPNIPTKWPACLLDIDNVPWSGEGDLIQMGIAQVSVKISSMRLSNSNVKAPDNQRTASASILDTMSDVHAALHGWHDTESMNGPLTRIVTRRIKRDDGIREYEMIYAVQITDDSAMPETLQYPMTRQKIKVVVNKL